MSDIPGHLARYKLDSEFTDNGVTHRTITSNIITGHRRIEVQKTWVGERKLGVGSFGEVFLQRETSSGQLRAVKVVLNQLKKMKLNELNALVMLQDRTDLFVTFLGWFEDSRVVYIAMEYIEHGDLDQYIIAYQSRARSEAPVISQQILEGLVVLHQRQICHRDLKPQNILVASVSPIWVKITDFGISKGWTGTALRTHCGTSSYKAPELSGLLPRELRSSGQNYGESVDIWALGVIVHQLLTTQIPFHRIDEQSTESSYYEAPEWNMDYDLVQDYCADLSAFPLGPLNDCCASPKAIDFVKSLMVPDPKKRPTAADALQSQWLSEAATAVRPPSPVSQPAARPESLPTLREDTVVEAPAPYIILLLGPKVMVRKFPGYFGMKWRAGSNSMGIRQLEAIQVGIHRVQLIIGPDYQPEYYDRQLRERLEGIPGRHIHGIICLCPISARSEIWGELALSINKLNGTRVPYFRRSMIALAKCHTAAVGHSAKFVMDWNSSGAEGISRGVDLDGIQKEGIAMVAYLIAQEHEARIGYRGGAGSTMNVFTRESLLAFSV